MIENNRRVIIYLNTAVDSIFKILPLFEEESSTIDVYIDSLLFQLRKLDEVLDMKYSHEYLSLMLTLKSIKSEILNNSKEHSVIKREVFKSISIIKDIASKMEVVD